MQKILFTGGGSAGHVVKNIILIDELKEHYPKVKRHYIGSKYGFEQQLITPELALLDAVPTGKLRRYFSLRTVPDFFSFCLGVIMAVFKVRRIRPEVVFSSGGYVALPTALAAWILKIPVVTHETDTVAGLANRLIGRIATKVCVGFEEVKSQFDPRRVVITGNPIRREIYEASQTGGRLPKGFSANKKTVLIVGGSQGAKRINELVLEILPNLTEKYQVLHQTGKGKSESFEHALYRQFEYLGEHYADYLAAADCVVTRGGGTLTEVYQLGKPTVVIPLSTSAGGHQMKNALAMEKKNDSFVVLDETKVSSKHVFDAIESQMLMSNGPMRKEEATGKILEVLQPYLTVNE